MHCCVPASSSLPPDLQQRALVHWGPLKCTLVVARWCVHSAARLCALQVTGDAWDGRPQLKLKILNLMASTCWLWEQGMQLGGTEEQLASIPQQPLQHCATWPDGMLAHTPLQFRFMVSENERLLASSRAGAAPAGSPARTPRQARWVGEPHTLQLPCSPWEPDGDALLAEPALTVAPACSFGRKGQAVQARAAHSRWGEAINELGRMQVRCWEPTVCDTFSLQSCVQLCYKAACATAGNTAHASARAARALPHPAA